MKVFVSLLVGVMVLGFVAGCWAESGKLTELKEWRDEKNLPISDEVLAQWANHPRVGKWVEIQEKKYGVTGIRKAIKDAAKKSKKTETVTKQPNVISTGKGADSDAW